MSSRSYGRKAHNSPRRQRRGPQQQRPRAIDPTAYELPVLLTRCPKCDVVGGPCIVQSTRGYGATKGQSTQEPHIERVRVARGEGIG